MPRLLLRSFAVAVVGLAAIVGVRAEEAAPGRDLVIDAGGSPVRVRVITTVDGKPIEDRRSSFIEALVTQADADEDGSISPAEWKQCFGKIGQLNVDLVDDVGTTPEALEQSLDSQLGPLMEIVVQPQPLVDRLELFAALDADDDSFITSTELSKAVALLDRYDADGDGTLNQPELAPTEPLQPTPLRSGADFPAGRFPFRWASSIAEPDVLVEIKLIGRAFGRPKITVTEATSDKTARDQSAADRLSISAESRKVAFDVAGVAVDLDATPARITSEDVKRFYLLQMRQRDADKNGYLDEGEFLGLGLPGLGYDVADSNGDKMLFPEELRERLDALIARETSRIRIEATYERQPLFTKLDADGDQRLSRRELLEAAKALAEVDADGDGRIGLAEFGGRYRLSFSVPNLLDGANPRMVADVAAMSQRPSPRAADGPPWFAAMDRNADGDLTQREFLGRIDLFASLDVDSDGLLSPEEAKAGETKVSTETGDE